MADLSTKRAGYGRHRAERGPGPGRYVGRVGALAVALGVGLAVSGGPGLAIAVADDTTGAADSSPADRADADPADTPPSPTDGAAEGDESDADESELNEDLDDLDDLDVTDDDADEDDADEAIDPGSAPNRTSANRATPSESAALQDLSPAELISVADIDEPVLSEGDDAVMAEASTQAIDIVPVTPAVVDIGRAVTDLIAPAADAPEPAGTASGAPVNAVTAAVGLLLSPFVTPGPAGPSEPPLSWAALAFARREIVRGAEAESVPVMPAESASAAALVAETMVRSGAAPAFPSAAVLPNLLEVIGSVVNGIISGIGNIISSVIGGFITGLQYIIAGLFNSPPVARTDTYSTAEDAALTTTATTGVLANDTDVNGNALTAQLVSGPSHGVLDLRADGTFTYTPTADYTGLDTFTYRASDGFATSATTTVSLNVVVAVDNPPIAADDSYNAVEATELTVPAGSGVLSNDSDPALTAQLVSGPSHGALTLNPDGSFTYTPAANFSGTDFFSYRASAGAATSDPATVAIAVALVDGEPPVVEVGEVDQLSGVVTGQVSVPSRTGNPVTYVLAAPVDPALGTVTVNATTGAWTFTPNPLARLDAAGAVNPVAARMVAFAAAADEGTLTFVIDATDGVNTVAVPVQVPIDAAEAVTTATIELASDPLDIAVHGDRLYITTSDRKILVFDRATNTKVGEIQAGASPSTLEVVGDQLYITDSPVSGGAGTVWVVDLTGNAGVTTIPVGQNPSSTVVDGTLLYVANVNDYTATIIDTTTNTVVDTIPVGFVPFGLAIGGDRLFAVNLVHGTVTVVDTRTNTIVDVDPSTPDVDAINLVTPFQNQLSALAVSGDQLYVTHLNGNQVFVVNTTTYTVGDPIDVGTGPAGVIAVGNRVYVANAGSGTVSVIDTATNTVIDSVPVGENANTMVAIGNQIFVVNATGNSISVITTRAQPTV